MQRWDSQLCLYTVLSKLKPRGSSFIEGRDPTSESRTKHEDSFPAFNSS